MRILFGLRTILLGSMIVTLMTLLGTTIMAPRVDAGVVRAPRNDIELDRYNRCPSGDYDIFGAAWVNGVAQSDTTLNRWSEMIRVPWNATTVDATLWTTAIACYNSDIENFYNVTVSSLANDGGIIPISFPYGNSVVRGDAAKGEWTDPPASLRVSLNIGNRPSGTYNDSVRVRGWYSDASGSGFPTTFPADLQIVRDPPPDPNPPVFSVVFNLNCNTGAFSGRVRDSDWSGAGRTLRVVIGRTSGGVSTDIMTVNTNVDGSGNFTGTLPASARTALITQGGTYYARAYSKNVAGSETSLTATSSRSVSPCNTGACGPETFPDEMVVGVGQTFTVSANLGVWSSSAYTASSNPRLYVTVQRPDSTFIFNDQQVNWTNAGNSITSVALPFTPTLKGEYRMRYRMQTTGGDINIFCAGSGASPGTWITGVAGDQPYFNTVGGDIMAGESSALNSYILAYNQNGSDYFGAGSQLGALATGDIRGYISGGNSRTGVSINTAVSSTTVSQVSFANAGSGVAVNPSAGAYGGRFNAMPNRSAIPPIPSGATALSGSITLTGLADGVYTVAAGSVIEASVLATSLADPERSITLYVPSGNIIINGNITYSYDSLRRIPRLNIYAQSGNIIFNNTVSRAHGVFVAEGLTATTGIVYTCGVSNVGMSQTNINSNADSCMTNSLDIVGSVTARMIEFFRTGGTWVNNGNVSERIIYSPEVWLHRAGASGTTLNSPFDSYISLPPIL